MSSNTYKDVLYFMQPSLLGLENMQTASLQSSNSLPNECHGW